MALKYKPICDHLGITWKYRDDQRRYEHVADLHISGNRRIDNDL